MDRRDYNNTFGPLHQGFDEQKMTMKFTLPIRDEDRKNDNGPDEEEVEVPATFEVCGTCGGKGTHVNPSIDAHGITQSEMRELGSEFQEEYMSGAYDVECSECDGKRVVPVMNEKRADERLVKRINDWIKSENEDRRHRAYEIERGC